MFLKEDKCQILSWHKTRQVNYLTKVAGLLAAWQDLLVPVIPVLGKLQ